MARSSTPSRSQTPPNAGKNAGDWRSDLRTAWENRAFSRPCLSGDFGITAEAAFTAIVNAANRARVGNETAHFCFWVDGVKQVSFINLLPNASDRTVEGWTNRLSDALSGQCYTLLLSEPQMHAEELWRQVRRFLIPVFQETGRPSGWTDSAIFLGRYHRTPFGIHQGPMGVLTLPLIGRKSFRLWDDRTIRRNPDLIGATDYDTARTPSRVLSAGVGGMIYWPSRDWHISEESGGTSMALSIGLWSSHLDAHPLRHFLRLLERVLVAAPKPLRNESLTLGVPVEVDSQLPETWRHYLEILGQHIVDGSLEAEMLAEQARSWSALGFKSVPPPCRRDFRADAPTRIDPLAVLTLSRIDPIRLCIAAGGHAFSITWNERIEPFLRRFQENYAVPVKEARIAADDECKPADLLRVLEQLALFGALQQEGVDK